MKPLNERPKPNERKKGKKKITFLKERDTVFRKVSKTDLRIGSDGLDMALDLMTLQLVQHFYSTLRAEQTLTYEFDRPTFFEWLFRKKRKVEVKAKIKDVLLNPPEKFKLMNTVRTYNFTING